MIHESGTYANASGNGIWMGQVTESSIDDAENPIETRYLGTATRNRDVLDAGPRDVTGTLTYSPQDMRAVFFSIGSVYSESGANAIHTATEINDNVVQSPFTSGANQLNAPLSFTLEDSKQAPGTGRNFIRTINGVVPNTATLSNTQGEKSQVSLDWIGQTLTHSSGTTTSVTEQTNRSYLWSDSTLKLAGSSLDTVKSVELEINQNREGPHYLNGSRDIAVPLNGNREYTLNVTLDLDSTDADLLYGLYKNTTKFNGVLDMDADSTAGSQHSIFTLSGCYITSMENPSANEGATESSIEIKPESISAKEYNAFGNGTFLPW